MKKKPETLTKEELVYELLFKKYNALDLSKILYTERLPDGTFTIKLGGKKISDQMLANIKNEATMIEQSQLWKMIVETLKNAAHQHMFVQMKTLEDSHYGKTILYNLSVIETIFSALKKPHVNPTPTNYQKKFSTPSGTG